MGIFQKLFGKPYLPSPTAEPLDETRFWQIVEDSIERSHGDPDLQQAALVSDIEKLTLKEIIGFRLTTDKLLFESYTSEMWCAGYIMNGGCSDDGFEYFRLWVISKGRNVYYAARENPDSLIRHVSDDAEFYEFEAFWYTALTAFEKRTGKNLYDFIDYDNFKASEGNYPNIEFTWTEEDAESRKRICPQLFERFENE